MGELGFNVPPTQRSNVGMGLGMQKGMTSLRAQGLVAIFLFYLVSYYI